MIKKKICMLGAFAAGKTSLVQRFVYSLFSEKYLTTVGVKIDKKTLSINGSAIDFILWDLHGEDEFQKVRMSYLRGAAGCIYVIDGTRHATVNVAFNLLEKVQATIGSIPFVLVLNKWDLRQDWEIDADTLSLLEQRSAVVVKTSAKTGKDVETAFHALARLILES